MSKPVDLSCKRRDAMRERIRRLLHDVQRDLDELDDPSVLVLLVDRQSGEVVIWNLDLSQFEQMGVLARALYNVNAMPSQEIPDPPEDDGG